MTSRSLSISLSAVLLLALTVGCGAQEPAAEQYTDRMAHEHAGDTPEPSPAATEPSAEVETSRVVYATIAGKEVSGYLARPAGAAAGTPGMIVIQEWWGLNENIETMARRLAGEGYVALAVDLYNGQVATDPEGARALMSAALENSSATEDNLRQAYAWLEKEQGAPKIGTIGWCFGGGWSLHSALMLSGELDAAVVYYGRLITDRERLAGLETPVIGFFGSADEGIPVATVREFERVTQELGKPVTVYVYEGADHAFANPSGNRYDQVAADDAWQKTLSFLAEHLKG